ncbi:MAG: VanZ family protein [Candidatus Sericytochromatia bacterium]|nr:VanZ family protein [Candidatus Sericytochromatia bacterium]
MGPFDKLMQTLERVPRAGRWGAAVAWMALIFGLSAQTSSGQHSFALVTWLLGLAGQHAGPEALAVMQLGIRKLGHVTEYAVLAALLGWALPSGARRWQLAWVLAVGWACTDEWHQTFVPSRVGAPSDVAIDGVGAALAALGGWRVERRRPR